MSAMKTLNLIFKGATLAGLACAGGYGQVDSGFTGIKLSRGKTVK